MLVDFSFKNVGSFKNAQNFSMRRDTGLELEKASIRSDITPDEGLNRVSAFYGANASGKTNFLDAIMALQEFVARGIVSNVGFVGSKDDSVFRIVYIYDGKKYDYTITVNAEKVKHEKLNIYYSKQPTLVFEYFADPRRVNFGNMISSTEGTAVDYNSQKEPGRPILYLLRDSDKDDAKDAYEFFRLGLVSQEAPMVTNGSVEARLRSAIEEDLAMRDFYNQIIPAADFGIKSVKLVDEQSDMNMEQLDILADAIIKMDEAGGNHLDDKAKIKLRKTIGDKVKRASFTHKIGSSLVNMAFSTESNGTVMASSIFLDLKYVLDSGAVYVIDEIDCSVHPTLVTQLINVFNHADTNPKGAQLVFTTHDVSLLDSSIYGENILDRDQVWFVEKNDAGESDLYPLTQVRGVRKGDNLYRKYVVGRYGAVPKVSLYYEMQKYWEGKANG